MLLYSTDVSLLSVDRCNNYTVLSEAYRAQGHIVINGNYRCDMGGLVPGWYRFQGGAGDRMADKCVPENHCGSRRSGWLFGTHPSMAEGVVTRGHSHACCNWYRNIRIRNCGAYFVYELPRSDFNFCGNGSAGNFLKVVLR